MNRLKKNLAHPPRIYFLGALALCGLLSFSSRWLNSYYTDVLIKIGINVTLAVSLNLINGYTGQFSLGNAGFMSVGAYTSAAITLFLGPPLVPPDSSPASAAATSALFVGALIIGGLAASVAGWLVG